MTNKYEVFREELALLNYETKDAEDVSRALVDKLFKNGSVKDTCFQVMDNHKRSYPTGFLTEGIQVAIPRAEVKYVDCSAFAIDTMPKPVIFGEMGTTPDCTLVLRSL